MNKTTLAAAIAMQLVASSAIAQNTTGKLTLAGNLVPTSRYEGGGIYSFSPAQGDITTKEVATDNYLNANGGSVATDGTFYSINYQDMGDEIYARLASYDMTEWENKRTLSYVGDMSVVATAMTWDASTQTIYGCFNNGTGNGYMFGTLTTSPRLSSTRILSLSKKYVALADNDAGTLYAIDSDGDLYTVDETTGAATKIGSTGVTPSDGVQSAVYEPTSGKIYWAAQTNGNSRLYEVDPSTATATAAGNFANNEQFASIFVSKPAANDDAPAAITELTPHFDGPSVKGTVSFTIPTTTYSGGQLIGNVDWFLVVENDTLARGTAAAGAEVTTDSITLANDYNQLVVVLRNDAGFSPKYKQSFFAGPGTPSGIYEATLSVDDNNLATITWEPSQGNSTDGYFVQDDVTYSVVRHPDEVTVAEGIKTTTITDQLPDASGVATYYYTITPEFMGNKGYGAETNKVNVGSGYTIPYFDDFDEGWIDRYTVVDVNGDYTTWWDSYDGSAYTQAGYDNGSDDWLITPDITFKPGLYKIAFKYWGGLPGESDYAGNALEVGFGQGTDPANLKIVGKIPNIILSQENRKEFTATVKVDKEGKYNVGIHDVSPSNAYTVYVDSLSITEGGTLNVPDTVSAFKALADADGNLSVALSFTAPSKTAGGDPLSDISAITITRDDSTVVKTFDNPTPGEQLTFTDTPSTGLTDGQHHYTVVAESAEGKGMEVYADVVVGIEVPGAVKDIKAKDEGQDGVKISWTAPQQSAEGHPLNADNLTYSIYANKYYTSERFLVAEGVKGTTYTDYSFDPDSTQLQVYYDIEAVNRAGASEMNISNQIIVGKPDVLPYKEGFDPSLPNQMAHLWWIDLTEDINTMSFFGFQVGLSSDGDNGCAAYVGAQGGCFGNLRTGKIALNGYDNPRLAFDYYCNGSEDALLTVQASSDLENWTDLNTIRFDSITATDEWHTAQVDLSSLTDPAYIYLRFHAESNNQDSPVIIDNVNITADNATGINAVLLRDDKPMDVYTIDGKLVRKNATSLRDLPTGLYIYGNRKVVVK